MASASVSVIGMSEVVAHIDAAMLILGAKVEMAIHEAAQTCFDSAQANAPVDTGLMRDTMTIKKGVMEAEVATNVDYSKYVELGHMTRGGGSFVPAQPFLTPAMDEAALELAAALSGLI